MWKRLPIAERPKALIKLNTIEGLGYSFKTDGKQHAYDLITGEEIVVDDPRADLILSARIKRHAEGSEVYDLILTLKMKTGGIQKAEDPYLFLAPEDGYEQEIVWKKHYDREDRESNNRLQGGFYLHYKNLIYASIYFQEAEFILDRDIVWLTREYIINPFGSRNLEYDPDWWRRLSKKNDRGEISDEEYRKLVKDYEAKDPIEAIDWDKMEEMAKILNDGRLPKVEDFLEERFLNNR